jgi:membrane protein implicated in regulation of membrane protease activity
MENRKLLLKIGSAILAGLWTLSSVLDIVDRYKTEGSQVLSNLASAPYELIVVLAGLTVFPLWLGYQFHAWRSKKTAVTPTSGVVGYGKRIEVKNKVFQDQDVFIDGHSWTNCKFIHCNIILERGDFDLIQPHFDGCTLTVRGPAEGILRLERAWFPRANLPPLLAPIEREEQKKRGSATPQTFPLFEIEEKGHDIDIIGGTYENVDRLVKMGKESHKVRVINPKVTRKKRRFWFW